jgi:hypothetical protein
MKRPLLLLMALASLMGACSPGAESFETADAVVSHLEEEGVSCIDAEELPTASLVKDSLRCMNDGAQIEIYVFDSEEERDNWLKVGKGLSGVITGPTWAIVAGERSDDVKEATGGETF